MGAFPPSFLQDQFSNSLKIEERKVGGGRFLARFNSLLFHTFTLYHVPLLSVISG